VASTKVTAAVVQPSAHAPKEIALLATATAGPPDVCPLAATTRSAAIATDAVVLALDRALMAHAQTLGEALVVLLLVSQTAAISSAVSVLRRALSRIRLV